MNDLTVVMYHYIRDISNSRYPNIKALDIKIFEKHIKYLRKNYYFITIEEIIYCIKENKSIPKSVLLTFDDAYTDHYTNVFPILDKYNIKGCFYAPIKAISKHKVLDVNKIHFILASCKNLKLLIKNLFLIFEQYKKEYKLFDFNHYYKKLAISNRFDTKEVIFFKRLLQVELPESLREKILNKLFEIYVGIPESIFSKELYMNENQLKHMIGNGMHIGNHGYNHYWWESINNEQLNKELDLSLHFLTKLGVDMNNWTACYPYGSYNSQTINILEERNCSLAFTTEAKVASLQNNHKLKIPRLDANDITQLL